LVHPGKHRPTHGQLLPWHKTYLFLKALIGGCFNELQHGVARALAMEEQLNKQIFKKLNH
jgi:hypothetical protein